MRVYSFAILSRLAASVGRGVLAALAVLLLPVGAQAHNLDTRATGIYFDAQQLALMGQRAGLNQQLVQPGDKFWVIMKTTPGPGTDTGVGGYQTFYVPPGVKVHGAAYVLPVPTTTDPRGFVEIPMKGQSPIAIGDGPIGAKSTPELIGFTLPGVNGLGYKTDPVTASGLHRGTIAGVYADTGIFYSSDPRTAFRTYRTPGGTPDQNPGTEPVLVNNSGDPVGEYDSAKGTDPVNILGVTTLWDSYQERGYGYKLGPIIDYVDQRGNAPWGLASVVAGPESGYAWEFDYQAYLNAGGPASPGLPHNAAAIKAAIKIGPWHRIQYPGSQISKDNPGLISAVLGYAGVDASTMGYLLNGGTPLERQSDGTGVNALRFAIGQLKLGRPEYSAVQIEIVEPVAANCYRIYGDAFGGDAGGTSNGKDHIWRYFDPSVVYLEPCVQLQKVGSKAIVAAGETFSYQIVFANNGSVALPNITLTDTLPSGLAFVSASPAPSSSASPTFTWTFPSVAPNQEIAITVYVKATGTGTQCNSISAKSGTTIVAMAEDCTEVGLEPLLIEHKSVTPSSVAPGGTVTYTITVDNIGTGANGVPLVVTDYLPAGFSYQSLVSATLNGATISPTQPVVGGTASQPTFTVSQGIQAGKKLVIVFTAQVGASVPVGNYCNGVEMAHDGIREGPFAEACVTVGGGRIGDTVYRDWNGNGAQDLGEEGIASITVQLYNDVNGNGVYDGGDTLAGTATTDANGNYLFTGLLQGNYVVRIPSPPAKYLNTGNPPGGAPANPTNEGAAAIVNPTDSVLTVDFGYKFAPTLPDPASGSIGDTVFNDQNGDGVFNGSDVGIDGVTVALYEDGNGNGVYDPATDAFIATTTTAGGGLYQFSSLPLGFDYLVYVNPADAALDAFFTNPYEATNADPHHVDNLAGDYTAADLGWIENLPSSIGDTVFEDSNRDGVYDLGSDIPLANVTVTLYRDSNHDGVADGPALATASTDSAGQYHFTGLGPDGYLVVVDTSDPELPSGLSASTAQHTVNLPSNTAYDAADFPFVATFDKSVDVAQATLPNQTLTYTLKPYWPGPDLLQNAVVSDPLPAGVTYVANSANAEGVHNGLTPGTVTWNLGSNSPGAPGVTAASGTALCPATPLVTVAVADTYLNEKSDSVSKNYGGAGDLLTRAQVSQHKHTLIRFDVSSLPANAIIASATMQIRVNAAQSGTVARIHNMLTAWTEGSANGAVDANGASWDDSDGSAGAGDWATGNFSAADYSATVYGSIGTATTGTKTADVTELVKQWYTSGVNRGLVLEATTTDKTGDVKFDTRTDTVKPTLTVKYYIQSASPCSGPTTLEPVADTYIQEDSGGNDNFGTDSTIKTRPEVTKQKSGLIRFDLASVPPGATISSATLRVKVQTAKTDQTQSVRRLLTAWTETGAQWIDADGAGPGDWATGTFSSSDYGPSLGTVAATPNNTYMTLDVTSTVNDWINNGVPNYGFALISTGAGTSDAAYDSREASAGNRPELVINWTQSVSTAAQTTTEVHVAPLLISGNQRVKVEMRVTADQSVANVTPPASLTVNLAGSVTATQYGTVSPVGPVNLVANIPTTFTYEYDVTVGVVPREIGFAGKPTSPNASFATGTSQGLIVTPALTFSVTVNNPPLVNVINNTATIQDDGALSASDSAQTGVGPSVGDFVWADLNGDGLQGAGEPGIPNVRVYLDSNNNSTWDWVDVDGDGTVSPGDTYEPFALTDATGHYRIYDVTAGNAYNVRYDLSTVPSGYAPSTATVVNTGTLGAAQQFNTADFGLIPQPQPDQASFIGDTLWIDRDQDGTVDAGDTPIANVDVKLYVDLNHDGLINGSDYVLQTTATDANGNYQFSGLGQGWYVVAVDQTDPQFPAGVSLVTGGSPANTPPDNGVHAEHITADGTNITTADFGYNYTGQIGDFVWYDTNGDGLQNETGCAGAPCPAPNATVVLIDDANGNGVADPGELAVATYTTCDGTVDYPCTGGALPGQYLFDKLPPGKYVVQLSEQEVPTPGHGPIGGMIQTTGGDKAVTLSAGNMQNLNADFGLIAGASLAGTVFHDVNHNGTLDAGDSVLPNVTVNLYGPGPDGLINTPDDVLVQTKSTGPTGEYLFLVAPGDYRIEYNTADTDIPLAIRGANGEATTPLSYTVSPVAGMEYSGYDFGRDNKGQIGDTIFADTNGTVGQQAGEPGLPGVTVELYLDNNNNNLVDVGDTLLSSQVTDANGKYLFPGLADGEYAVKVVTSTLPAGYQNTPTTDPEGALDSMAGATVTAGAAVLDRDFGYPPTVTTYAVSGNVWDDNGATGGTHGNGIKDGLEPGLNNVTLTISVDADGAGGNPPVLYTVQTDSSGNYSLSGVPAGAAVVIKVDPTALPNAAYQQTGDPDLIKNNQTSFTMPAANKPNQNFGYEAQYGSIAGTVAKGNGNGVYEAGVDVPLSGVTVTLYSAGPDGIFGSADDVGPDGVFGTADDIGRQVKTTAADGSYSFGSLVPGNYRVVETDPAGYVSVADRDGGNPNSIDVTNLASNQNVTGRDFEDTLPDPVIGDFVWLDENGDGKQDAGEAGIANVTVRLYDISSGSPVLVATTVTDANGGYLFKSLTPNNGYRVVVDTTTLPAGLAANQTYDPDVIKDSQTDVTTPANGEGVFTADFGYNWAPSSDVTGNTGTGMIGDRVWVDANGNGKQDPGEPGLGGATVQLWYDSNADGVIDAQYGASVTTAADGSYAFDNLPAGLYEVRITGGVALYTQTGDPDQPGVPCTTCDSKTTVPILLAPGDVYVNADFGFQAPAAQNNSVSGVVFMDVNDSGTKDLPPDYPEPGVTVALIRDVDNSGTFTAGDLVVATTATDLTGAYAFNGLPDGKYLVWVNDTGNILTDLKVTVDPQGALDGWAAVDLDSAGTDPAAYSQPNQDFGYTPLANFNGAGVIGDTVYLDLNGNGTQNAGEPGLEGVTVELWDSGHTTLLGSTTTDENGRYLFGGLDAGTYQVEIVTSTLPGGVADPMVNTGDPDTVAPGDSKSAVTLVAGEINLAQDFGYRDQSTPNTISGTIWNDLDAAGDLDGGETGRFGGVTVVLKDSSGNIVSTAVTDANGNYSFPGLPNGSYTVDVTDTANVLNGLWHSLGAAGDGTVAGTPAGQSQSDPYTIAVGGGASATVDFGYYSTPSALGDFVWRDNGAGSGIGGNGVQDGTEPGLQGVAVTLTITWPNSGGTTVVTTTTDASGLYAFGNLLLDENFTGSGGAGQPSFSISVATPSGLTASPSHAQGGDTSVDSGSPAGEAATVAKGATNNTYDFGFYGAYSISGKVLDDGAAGNGTIDDPGDTPLENVKVELYRDNNNNGQVDGGDTLVDTQYTNASGGYTFAGQPEGNYLVVETDPAGKTSVTDSGEPDANNDNNTIDVTLSGGNSIGNNFLDKPSSATAARLAYFRAVSAGASQVQLSWGTLVEFDLLGFRVDRATTDGGWQRLTAQMIPATGFGSQPQTYGLLDGQAPATAELKYRLVEVSLTGQEMVLAYASVEAGITVGLTRTLDGLSLSLSGAPNSSLAVEVARSVTGPWTRLQTVTLDGSGSGVANFGLDHSAPARFFRVVSE